MSVASHHNEWMQLVDVSGPFLSLPVLMRVFPQEIDALDSGLSRDVRQAYLEWEEAEGDRAIHTAWIEFVLKRILQFPGEVVLHGQALPPGLEVRVAEHGEDLRPSYAIKRPEDALPSLLVVTYPTGQRLDGPVSGARWPTASPATRMMTLLHGTGVSCGLVSNGTNWQLVAARTGQTTTYVTWDAGLWSEEPLTLRAFCALLGVKRTFNVPEPERLPALLAESALNQQEVTDQLGYQVRKAVEVLVQAVDRVNQDEQGRLLAGVSETQLYEAALTVMMRLVFVFAAEERGLLLKDNPLWDRNYSILTLRDQLREVSDENLLTYRHDAWSRLLSTFRTIFGGVEHDQMRLPAYGGALFDPDRFTFLEGRAANTTWRVTEAHPLPINNLTVLHLLEALQFLNMRLPGGGSEPRRLSFRALDVEQIGNVYEGLLDHTAKRAASSVLGLRGSGGEDVEVELSQLEAKATEGEEVLVEMLKDKTGRQPAALRRDLARGEPPNPLVLQAVCAGYDGLYDRIRPFAHILRDDSAGQPVVIHTGSVYVTAGSDRRSTGTHYTPGTLTQPVVKTTLDPLVYSGVESGAEPTRENLKSPSEILALKVCDLACGSGAFLVQACRYLAERLVEAWGVIQERTPGPLTIPEAIPAGAHHAEQILSLDPEERLAVARRLVAERCLYGVDVNPMAVEMAKLSLWLVTLHKHRPFTFLDHAIKCGDSLLGLHQSEQLEKFHLVPARTQALVSDYIREEVHRLLVQARQKREQLECFTVIDIQDAEFKARLHREAEASLVVVRLMADLIVGAGLATAGSNETRSGTLLDVKLETLVLDVGDILTPRGAEPLALDSLTDEVLLPLRQKAQVLLSSNGAHAPRRPFHWLVEFPEVFLSTERPGFDALAGNPPFIGGQKITGLFGTDYRDYLVLYHADGRRGSADFCVYFFLRAAEIVRNGGNFGLLAVNTIAEGDTRQVGLEAMLQRGLCIYAADPNFQWPGSAAVSASSVHCHRGPWHGQFRLSSRGVSTISAFLSAQDEWSPKRLIANANKSFQGSIVLGMGFTLPPEVATALISQDTKNAEVLFPYVGGEDINGHPEQKSSRWVINFWDWPLSRDAEGVWQLADSEQRDKWLGDGRVPFDYPGRVAEDFPGLIDIVRRFVLPERLQKNDVTARRRWWLHLRPRPELCHAIGRGHAFAKHPLGWHEDISPMQEVLAFSLHSKYWSPVFIDSKQVFSHALGIIATESYGEFAVLHSSLHGSWAWNFSSSLETRLRYTPTDVFETFPFPDLSIPSLTELGSTFSTRRSELLVEHQLGLTELMNEFNDPDTRLRGLADLRAVLSQIDDEVARAYEWTDIALEHGFHKVAYLPESSNLRFTICEAARLEILRRLAKLNRDRYAEELERQAQSDLVAASALPAGAPRRGRRSTTVHQGGLF